MFDLFVNPWAMVAGTILIGSPIVIHLINRMRFRRVRWAAMEFLLKSQKRNRRRIIIEQILLLLLRILLVLLAGLLLARLAGLFGGADQQQTLHVVLLDPTASMADAHREGGKPMVAFDQAKRIIADEIATAAGQATAAQSLVLLRLDDLENPKTVERVGSGTAEELRDSLADREPTFLHIDLVKGLDAAGAIFEQSPKNRRVLHIVGDFRNRDWSGGSAEAIRQAVERLRAMKVEVQLLDAAYPVRNESQRTVVYHDNLGFTDLQPETRIAARYMPVEFSCSLANYSNSERKNVRVTVKVKNQERAEGSFTIPSLPPGTVTVGTFMVAFDELGPNPVSVHLEAEEAGLAIDNVRYSVVECRERVPLLVIEGDPKSRGTAESDTYFIESLFGESTRGFEVRLRPLAELEKPDLNQYPVIYVCNAPRLSDKALANLDAYVRAGGGVGFFLGGEVKPDFYNSKLYAGGQGLFPVPLADKPTEAPDDKTKLERMLFDLSPKIYARDEGHPLFSRIYRDEKSKNRSRENNIYLVPVGIDRYFPVPRNKWTATPGAVDEAMTLPNTRDIDIYREETQRVLDALPLKDSKYEKFAASLNAHNEEIRRALLDGGALYKLAGPLDRLLNDPGIPNDPAKPNLQEFWQRAEMTELRGRLASLLEVVRYGDPFLVLKNHGKGRVAAYLSTAGTAWNNLPNGPGQPYYVMLMVELQKYLANTTADVNLKLGQPLALDFDATRYETEVQRFFPPKPAPETKGAKPPDIVDGKRQTAVVTGNRMALTFTEARNPGVYSFVLKKKGEEAAAPVDPKDPKPPAQAEDVVAYSFNVDTEAEGDLKRAGRDDLMAAAPGATLQIPGSGWETSVVKQKRSDLSDSAWLFLLFLIVLMVEQAMAVRLSHHAAANDVPAR